jgi:hypothetical protein
MTNGLRSKLARGSVTMALAAAIFAVAAMVAPTAAQAVACSNGYFCWYSSTGQGGSRGLQFYYTGGWIAMSSLVDDSESSYDQQTSDGTNCRNNNNPFVYLSDTYFSTRWTALAGTHNGDAHSTFNPINTNFGSLNMNNLFNDIWNLCA